MKVSLQIRILGSFVLAAVLSFSNTLNCYFLSDDFSQIGKVLSGDFSVTWGQAHGGFFRPLFILSYIVDTRIWGAWPPGFHLTNVVMHGLNCFLVYLVSAQIFRDEKLSAATTTAISLAAAVLFLVHPSHTEAVSWISGRADIFATFFSLASLLFYLLYVEHQRHSQLALSLICFALALLSKESAVCVPFLLLLTTMSKHASGRNVTRSLKTVAPFALLLLLFIAVRAKFIGSLVGGYGIGQHLNFSPGWLRDRLLEATVRSFLPALPRDWSFFLYKPLKSRLFIFISFVSVGLMAGAIALRRRQYDSSRRKSQNRLMLMLAGLFLVSLLPVINLRLSLYQSLGERFVYLPSVFTSLFLAYVAAILIHNPRVWSLILVGIIGFHLVVLYRTNQGWCTAARLTRSISTDLLNSGGHDKLLVINAPDNLDGIPVFHNGLAESLQYFGNRKSIQQVNIIAFQNLKTTTDEVQVMNEADIITVRTQTGADEFRQGAVSECAQVVNSSSRSLEINTKACAAEWDLFVFDGGKMILLHAN